MAESFDPYHIWLGIPPAEQPADHYRLLGVSRFESNLEVIANAADQRVRHIRNMQTGSRQAESQVLLNEIAAAAGVLQDPLRKRQYDESLRRNTAVVSVSAPPSRRPMAGQNSKISGWIIIGTLSVAAVILVALVIANAPRKEPKSNSSVAKTETKSGQPNQPINSPDKQTVAGTHGTKP